MYILYTGSIRVAECLDCPAPNCFLISLLNTQTHEIQLKMFEVKRHCEKKHAIVYNYCLLSIIYM